MFWQAGKGFGNVGTACAVFPEAIAGSMQFGVEGDSRQVGADCACAGLAYISRAATERAIMLFMAWIPRALEPLFFQAADAAHHFVV